MSNYTKATNFATKDALTSGNPLKTLSGTELDDEFNAIQTASATKANIASAQLTGIPVAPTAAAATSTTQLATTAFVTTADNLKANLASPTFTGVPAAPTAAADTSTTQLATTAFVTTEANLKADLAGAAFTGAITTTSTIDGRDVAADGVTADAALPKAGGTMTGAILGTVANRLTTDGTIVDLQKDGTSVGSIGYGAGVLGIGQGTGNLGLFNATVIPMGSTSGAASDGVITLGSSARRFKDAYLSGGVYLGGTGAANKLDDYETGTWTPVPASGITVSGTETWSGGYTKIGNKVFYTLETSGTGTLTIAAFASISGLPFVVSKVDTGLCHDSSGGERSITEVFTDETIYIIADMGSNVLTLLASGSYTTSA